MFIIFSLVFIDSFHLVLIFMAWQLPPLVFLAPYLVIRSLTFIFCTRIIYLFFVFALILPRLPFRLFNLASPFFFFFFDFWFLIFGILLSFTQLHFLFLSIWQTSIFPRWICISPWYPLILSNALSFFLTWLNSLFWWNVS